ncbi:MAG: NAD-dependent epimerase/dehydratase family protein [Bacteroidota bacterium]|nr:NAD-dependent epimerase/dehydratase family protein [Bacteroidota bacterium]
MKILVTGGLGFVGSNLVDHLIDLGHDVTVIDNLSSASSSESYKNNSALYIIDDIKNINQINFDTHFEIIYHLAGLARIQPSFENPIAYIQVNIIGTAIICEFAKKNNAKLIYSSSSSINNGKHKTPYTFSKWSGEEVLKTWRKCYSLNASICRFYNVYGPREPKTGDYATVVRKFIRQYKNNEPITIVGDGNQRRDFTHVSDIVAGLIKVASHNQNDLFHLGRGINYSINQLASMFNYNKIQYIPLRKGEGLVTLADYQETFTKLNWQATYNLEDYIKDII